LQAGWAAAVADLLALDRAAVWARRRKSESRDGLP
jgi:hypothetical protein